MSTPMRLLVFGLVLAGVFGGAFALGGWVDPEADVETHDESHGGTHDTPTTGLRLELAEHELAPAPDRELRFAVVDADRRRVASYTERHERDLHLVVVNRADLADYQHVHPVLGADGLWSVPLRLRAGSYRVYADTQPEGAEPVVLETDLHVTGSPRPPVPLPAARRTDTIGPYDVALERDGSTVTLTVSRDGRPVTDLEPYLGASGHLVVIRADDLAYLHAHPEDGPAGPDVDFEVGFDGPGAHVAYFEFQHRGVVRTAMFRLDGAAEREPAPEHGTRHDH